MLPLSAKLFVVTHNKQNEQVPGWSSIRPGISLARDPQSLSMVYTGWDGDLDLLALSDSALALATRAFLWNDLSASRAFGTRSPNP